MVRYRTVRATRVRYHVHPMDLLTLLKKDHDGIGEMLDQIADCKAGDERLDRLAESIEKRLTVHAAIEEKIFYPALRDQAKPGEETIDVFEAYTEHDVIKHLIDLLQQEGRRDEAFLAGLQVLAESVKHHVKEEEKTIFALAKKRLDGERLDEMGMQAEQMKSELLGTVVT